VDIARRTANAKKGVSSTINRKCRSLIGINVQSVFAIAVPLRETWSTSATSPKKTVNTYGLDQVIVNININFTRFNDEHRLPVFPLRENDASGRERLGNHLFLKNVGQLHGRFICFGSRTARTERNRLAKAFASDANPFGAPFHPICEQQVDPPAQEM
jgi:hypothetical protein